MKYTIKFKDASIAPIKNLSLDEAVDYRVTNTNRNEYEIVEQTNRQARKPKEENEHGTRDEFLKTISHISRIGLQQGRRQVKYSKDIGWYLIVIEQEHEFISTEALKREKQEKIKIDIAVELESFRDEVYKSISKLYEGISKEDFDKLFNEVTS